MKTLPIFQIDAFADQLFTGNPAAVVPLDSADWPDVALLQNIAMENNLSETAFLLPLPKQQNDDCDFHLRWFTPLTEVRLCGHATFASAHWYFTEADTDAEIVRFKTLSGVLTVTRTEGGMTMSLAAEMPSPLEITNNQLAMLGLTRAQVLFAGAGVEYLQVVVESESLVRSLTPDLTAMKSIEYGGVIVTALAVNQRYDFVGRFFAPMFGIDEDPVTGSAFAVMAPYWHAKLGRQQLLGYQASQRGGFVHCEASEDRILMTGKAVTFLKGKLCL